MTSGNLGKRPLALACGLLMTASLCLPALALADVDINEDGQAVFAEQTLDVQSAQDDVRVSVSVESSGMGLELPANSKQALANTATRLVSDCATGTNDPDYIQFGNSEDLEWIKNVLSDAGENDSVLVTMTVDVHLSDPGEAVLLKKADNESVRGFDLSISVFVSVVDSVGDVKSATTVNVAQLPEPIEFTVTMPRDFSLANKAVRLARSYGDEVDFVGAATDADAGIVTFCTDRFHEYAVFASEKVAEKVPEGTGQASPVDNGTIATLPATGDSAAFFAGASALVGASLIASQMLHVRRRA